LGADRLLNFVAIDRRRIRPLLASIVSVTIIRKGRLGRLLRPAGAPSQFLLDFLEFRPHAVASGLPVKQKVALATVLSPFAPGLAGRANARRAIIRRGRRTVQCGA
jgi:hypothetical protein